MPWKLVRLLSVAALATFAALVAVHAAGQPLTL
ncbi:hypothetical protein AMIS_22560 [Actinoplanes missouriensis 431]|uniref:Uncharacterized protein n=1 Tax=Actinoplanes missouriensis (strain ATCC 14538 / DSM 43046 / CBS 188.64 / JCM 3121 / NBRC 102363 / NCIMB 12654 / NRRL B-3342 / UNCC 431) TaxID=512565 RepID=I0H389_ACTM4|nr:hypothetical protein AMIS_22560 [Actinoplanes missouriensis 431]